MINKQCKAKLLAQFDRDSGACQLNKLWDIRPLGENDMHAIFGWE